MATTATAATAATAARGEGLAAAAVPAAGGLPATRRFAPLDLGPPVSAFLAWIRSPCLRHCVHGAPIGLPPAATSGEDSPTGPACGLHADIGLLTLSPRADLPGLTVLDSSEWGEPLHPVRGSMLTEIHLCHACSCHAISKWRMETPGQGGCTPSAACTVFAGECLGLWTDGKITAPLHFVDESSQVAAAQAAEGAVRHSVCSLLLLRGPCVHVLGGLSVGCAWARCAVAVFLARAAACGPGAAQPT
jgi:hypothetical protein